MIEVNNLTTSPINKVFLREVAQKVLKDKKKNIDLSIALVGPKRIKELNRKYKRKNRATDVLSFQYDNSGEIVICPREVKKNAKIFNSNFKIELARVLIHGILHLLGENHEKSRKEAKKMESRQNYYLKMIFNKI